MSKLPEEHQFTDLSDYGRPAGKWIAQSLVLTRFTPIDVTTSFIIAGLCAIVSILNGFYVPAALFLVLKSILAAADGELSRLKKTPSYIGRYYDSIADLILNALLLTSVCFVTNGSFIIAIEAFFALQLQGPMSEYKQV